MNSVELVKAFCEDEFERFQEWLDEVREIEPTEAEYILDGLGEGNNRND